MTNRPKQGVGHFFMITLNKKTTSIEGVFDKLYRLIIRTNVLYILFFF